MLDVLDAPAVRRWSAAAALALHAHRDVIDELNVYPIPDGDTGRNLSMTLRAAADAVEADPATDVGVLLRTMARGAVLGARGNSGVITAQLLCGLADGLTDAAVAGPEALRKAFALAADLAYGAVADPVEGTILSVARAAADAAGGAESSVPAIVTAALDAARVALARTTEQLPALAAAGVVDAGGCGLVVLIEELVGVVTGAAPEPIRTVAQPGMHLGLAEHFAYPGEHFAYPGEHFAYPGEHFAYEVQYLLDAEDSAVATLRVRLGELAIPWPSSAPAIRCGTCTCTSMTSAPPSRPASRRAVRTASPSPVSPTPVRTPRPPAETVGSGSRSSRSPPAKGGRCLPRRGGRGGGRWTDRHPATHEVLAAIRATGAASVVLLPNAAQIGGVAEVAAGLARAEGIVVAVVPTRSPVQGLAAVAVHLESRRFEDDVITMAEAAASTRWAEVTVAARDALTMAGPCYPGDVLGLIGDEVVEIGGDVAAVGRSILERLLGVGGELVTLLVGVTAEDASVTS